MSIVALEVDDASPSYFSDYRNLVEEVETTLGKVSLLTDLIHEEKQQIEAKLQVKNNKELSKKENYDKMVNVALFALELYLLYVLPIGLVSRGLEKFSWIGFADSVDGKLTSLLLGLSIGRCLQIFLRTFYTLKPLYDCNCESNHYESLRYDAIALIRTTEEKVDLFSKLEENADLTSLIQPLKEQLNNTAFNLLHQFPHPSLILGK